MTRNIARRFARQGLLGMLWLAAAGCGLNPLPQGKPAPAGPVAEHGAGEQGAPGPAAPQAGPEAPGAERPVAKTPLIKGLTEVLDGNPALEDETKNSLRDQLQQADDLLSGIKNQNRAVLREVNRQPRRRRSDSPNVIIIIAHGLAVGDLGCYGNADISTPNIDQLAAAGIRCTDFHAGSPNPIDAHWCLATGRRPDEAAAWSMSAAVLRAEDITIGEALWQAGYTTGLYGDWGAAGVSGPALPADQGYDEWLGAFGSVSQPQPFPATLTHNGKLLKLTKNADGKQGQLAQDFIVAEAADFVARNHKRRPVFLQVYFSVPGSAGIAGDLGDYADKPWPEAVKTRAAAVTRLDRDIGKLRQKLNDLQQLSNTVFLITSDTPGRAVPTAGKPIRTTLREGELYQGGLRVPFIISGTRRIPVNQDCAVVSAAWDLAPTVYDLVSAQKRPVHKAGKSLVPFLSPGAKLPVRFLYWERQHGGAEIAARWKNWKVIRHAGRTEFELYDLSVDPGETKNVVAQHPQVMIEIQARLTPATEDANVRVAQ